MADWPLYLTAPLALIAVIGFWIAVYHIFRRPTVGLYLCFFATSILLSTNLPVFREKLSITEFVIAITWMAMLVNRDGWINREKPLLREQRNVLLLGWAFVFWVLLSYGLNNLFYATGFVGSTVESANFIYGFLLFRTTVALVDDWDRLRNCLIAWLIGGAVVSIVGVWALKGGAPAWAYEEFTNRVSSTLRNENQVASFLLPILPFAFFLVTKYGTPPLKRLGAAAIFGAAILTLIATGSRTALLMLIILFLSAGVLVLKELGARVIRRELVLLGVAVLGIAGTLYVGVALQQYEGDYALGRTPSWQRPVVLFYEWAQGKTPLDRNREAQIVFALENFIENPILGVGPKQTSQEFSLGEIHNTYLGILIELGVPGLIIFLSWLLGVLVLAQRTRRRLENAENRVLVWCLLVGMVLLLVYSGTIFGLRQRNIWLMAGLLAALPRVAGLGERETAKLTGRAAPSQPAVPKGAGG